MIDAWRGTGPRPTVNGDGFLFVTVARRPVPRDRPRAPVTVVRARLRVGGKRVKILFVTVVRGPVPRDLNWMKQEQDLHDLHDFQDYLPRNEQSFCNGCLFRSFRTCMSIETHVDLFSRSARTLMCGRQDVKNHIKDLKALRAL